MAHDISDTPKDIEFPRTVIFRLTEEQWQYLRGMADETHQTISEFLRKMILKESFVNGRKI